MCSFSYFLITYLIIGRSTSKRAIGIFYVATKINPGHLEESRLGAPFHSNTPRQSHRCTPSEHKQMENLWHNNLRD